MVLDSLFRFSPFVLCSIIKSPRFTIDLNCLQKSQETCEKNCWKKNCLNKNHLKMNEFFVWARFIISAFLLGQVFPISIFIRVQSTKSSVDGNEKDWEWKKEQQRALKFFRVIKSKWVKRMSTIKKWRDVDAIPMYSTQKNYVPRKWTFSICLQNDVIYVFWLLFFTEIWTKEVENVLQINS